jgi:four helix bundle protein
VAFNAEPKLLDVAVAVAVDGPRNQKLAAAEGSLVDERDEGVFGFEKLDVYRCAAEFLAISARIVAGLPTGQHSLAEQLRRAAISVPVNIAEGVGRTTVADRRRHFSIARGSAMECAALLDACRILVMANADLLKEGRKVLIRVVSMLTRMCRS